MSLQKGRCACDGSRLQRVSTLLDENVLKDDDPLFLQTDATSATEKIIVQDKIPVIFLSLPLEIFVSITTLIDVIDVENLTRTCKDLHMLVNKTFITRVVLPLSVKNMENLGGRNGRYVLSLSTNAILWDEDEFECTMKSMNLKYLKEVKFAGLDNASWKNPLSSFRKRTKGAENQDYLQSFFQKSSGGVFSSEQLQVKKIKIVSDYFYFC